MNLKDQLIHDAMTECATRVKIIDQHAGQIAEAESLAETLNAVAPSLGSRASAYITGDIMTTRVLVISARESELRAALAAADLDIASVQYGTSIASNLRVHLAGGLRTVIDVIIIVDEIPAAMPLAA